MGNKDSLRRGQAAAAGAASALGETNYWLGRVGKLEEVEDQVLVVLARRDVELLRGTLVLLEARAREHEKKEGRG